MVISMDFAAVHPLGSVYVYVTVTVSEPGPPPSNTKASAGSNAPVFEFVIPLPDQLPPEGVACRVTGAANSQKGPAGVSTIEAPGFGLIVSTASDLGPGHPLQMHSA